MEKGLYERDRSVMSMVLVDAARRLLTTQALIAVSRLQSSECM